jgi:hypothetical protein
MAKKNAVVDNTRHFELVAALKVLILSPATAAWLQAHDPKAFAQAGAALGLTLADLAALARPVETHDVVVTQEGSVFHFALHTDAVRAFVPSQFALEPWQWLGDRAFAVDHRFAPQVVCILRDGGFDVEVR